MWYLASDEHRPAEDDGWTPSIPALPVPVGASPTAALAARLPELVWPWHVWRVTPFAERLEETATPWGTSALSAVLAVHEEVAPSGCWGPRGERVPDLLSLYEAWLAEPDFRASVLRQSPPTASDDPESRLLHVAVGRVVVSSVSAARLGSDADRLSAVLAPALVALVGDGDRESVERMLAPAVAACVETSRLDALLG